MIFPRLLPISGASWALAESSRLHLGRPNRCLASWLSPERFQTTPSTPHAYIAWLQRAPHAGTVAAKHPSPLLANVPVSSRRLRPNSSHLLTPRTAPRRCPSSPLALLQAPEASLREAIQAPFGHAGSLWPRPGTISVSSQQPPELSPQPCSRPRLPFPFPCKLLGLVPTSSRCCLDTVPNPRRSDGPQLASPAVAPQAPPEAPELPSALQPPQLHSTSASAPLDFVRPRPLLPSASTLSIGHRTASDLAPSTELSSASAPLDFVRPRPLPPLGLGSFHQPRTWLPAPSSPRPRLFPSASYGLGPSSQHRAPLGLGSSPQPRHQLPAPSFPRPRLFPSASAPAPSTELPPGSARDPDSTSRGHILLQAKPDFSSSSPSSSRVPLLSRMVRPELSLGPPPSTTQLGSGEQQALHATRSKELDPSS